jgi:hypothetical protein
MSRPLVLGAVAYDPKVVTIWNGFRAYLRTRSVELDYVLYSNYERQVEDLVRGRSTSRGTLHWLGSGRDVWPGSKDFARGP